MSEARHRKRNRNRNGNEDGNENENENWKDCGSRLFVLEKGEGKSRS